MGGHCNCHRISSAEHAFVKPLARVMLTLPATILTLGLFLLVINAAMILLAREIVPGFSVDGFWYALLLSLFLISGKWFV
jgi:uncharacterized membrane protein YvlD (DUF360 family)